MCVCNVSNHMLPMFKTTCLLHCGIPFFKGGCPLFSARPWQEYVLRGAGGSTKRKSSEGSCFLVFQSPFWRTPIGLTCGGKRKCSQSSCFPGLFAITLPFLFYHPSTPPNTRFQLFTVQAHVD